MAENVRLTTKDGKSIAALYYGVPAPKGWMVYSHMMPATKESWKELAEYLQAAGYAGLAIDLRGHGESDGGPNGYKNFSDAEHAASIYDLEAAAAFLSKAGAMPAKMVFAGASIGANLSLKYISIHPECKTAIVLSAGLNYRGIATLPPVKSLKSDQRVFFAASRDDGNSAEENQALYDALPGGATKKIELYATGGHGTSLFASHPELTELIKKFIAF